MKENVQLEEAIARIFDCDWDADDYNPEGPMYDYAQKILADIPMKQRDTTCRHLSNEIEKLL